VTCVEDEKIIQALSTIPSSEDVETTGAGCDQKRKQGEVLRSTDLCTRALLWLALLVGGLPAISKSTQSCVSTRDHEGEGARRRRREGLTDVVGVEIVQILSAIASSEDEDHVQVRDVVRGVHVADRSSRRLRSWDPALAIDIKPMDISSSAWSTFNPPANYINLSTGRMVSDSVSSECHWPLHQGGCVAISALRWIPTETLLNPF
jgi:hypothetical protein